MSRLSSAVLILTLFGGKVLAQKMPGYNSRPNQASAVEGENTSLIQLIANPVQYDNKRVRIIGYLRLEFEGNAIYLHKEDFDQSLSENSIWVNVPRPMTKTEMEQVNNRYVILEGVFHARVHGHMDLFSGELSDINRLEPWNLARTPK